MTDDHQPDPQPTETVSNEAPLDEATLASLEARLDSDALWAEPPAELEANVLAAIAAEVAATPTVAVPEPTRRTQPRWLRAVAAVLIIAGGIGLVTTLTGGDDDEPEGDLFALGPTELAEGATGEVEFTVLRNGLRIILAVDDLPPAPEGQFYEAWLSREGGGVSAGTFHMRSGSGRIELWAGVTTDDYERFVITLEDEDGDASSSRRAVFVAPLHADQ